MAELLDIKQGTPVFNLGSDTGGDHCEAALSISGRASSDASAASSIADELHQRSPDSSCTRSEPGRPLMVSDHPAKAAFLHAATSPHPASSSRPADVAPGGGPFKQQLRCHFNVVVAGASNLGKTCFISNIASLVGSSGQRQPQRPLNTGPSTRSPLRTSGGGGGGSAGAPRGPTRIATLERNPSQLCTTLAPLEVDLPGDPATRRQLHLSLVDVPGYDEEPNKVLHLAKLMEYILRQRERDYRAAFRASSLGAAGDGDRSPLPHSVSLCLYFLPPQEVSATDLTYMSAISREVPVLPVLALGGRREDGCDGLTASDPHCPRHQHHLAALRRSVLEAMRSYTRNGKPAPIIPLELDTEAVDLLLLEPTAATTQGHHRGPEEPPLPTAAADQPPPSSRRRRSSGGSSLQVLMLGQEATTAATAGGGADVPLSSPQQHSDAVLLRRLLHQSVEPVLRGATERFEDFCQRYEAYGHDLMGLLADVIDPYETPLHQAVKRDAEERRNRKPSEVGSPVASAAASTPPAGSPVATAAAAAAPSPPRSPSEPSATAAAAVAAAADASPPASKVASPAVQQPSLPHTPEQHVEAGAASKRERQGGDDAAPAPAPAPAGRQHLACPTVLITTSPNRAPAPGSALAPAAAPAADPEALNAFAGAAGAAALGAAAAEVEPSTGSSDVDRVVTAIEEIVTQLSQEVDGADDGVSEEGEREGEGGEGAAAPVAESPDSVFDNALFNDSGSSHALLHDSDTLAPSEASGVAAAAATAAATCNAAAVRAIVARLVAAVVGPVAGTAAKAPWQAGRKPPPAVARSESPGDAVVQRALGSIRAAAATLAAVAQDLAPSAALAAGPEGDGADPAAAAAVQAALQRALASVFAASVALAPSAEASPSPSVEAAWDGGTVVAVQAPLQRAFAAAVDASVALAPVAEPTEAPAAAPIEVAAVRAAVQRALTSVSSAADALAELTAPPAPAPALDPAAATAPVASGAEDAAAVVHVVVHRAIEAALRKAELEGTPVAAPAAAAAACATGAARPSALSRLVHLGLSTLFATWERARARAATATATTPSKRAPDEGVPTAAAAGPAADGGSCDEARDVVHAMVRRVFAAAVAAAAAPTAPSPCGSSAACKVEPLTADTEPDVGADRAAGSAGEAEDETAAVVHTLVHRPLAAAVAAEANDAALVHALVHGPLAAAVAAEANDAAIVHNLVRRALTAAVAEAEAELDDDAAVVHRVVRRAFLAAMAEAEGKALQVQVAVQANCSPPVEGGAQEPRTRTWQQLGAELLTAFSILPKARTAAVVHPCVRGSGQTASPASVSGDAGPCGAGGGDARSGGMDVASGEPYLGLGVGMGVAGLAAGTMVLLALRHYRQPPPQQ